MSSAIEVTVADTYVGSEAIFNITANKGNKLKIEWSWTGHSSEQIYYNQIRTPKNFTWGKGLSTEMYNYIAGKEITVTVNSTLYDNQNNIVGTNTTTFKAMANPDACIPQMDRPYIQDINSTTTALTGNNQKLILGYSTADVFIAKSHISTKYNATISSVKINGVTAQSRTVSGTQYYYATFTNTDTNKFTLEVKDSRGFVGTNTNALATVSYNPLTLNMEAKRVAGSEEQISVTISGNYYNDSFGSQSNSLTVYYNYREQSSSTWSSTSSITPTITDNTYSKTQTLNETFDTDKIYEIRIRAIDKLQTIESIYTVSKAIPIFDYGEDEDGNNYFNVNGGLYENNVRLYNSKIIDTANTDLDDYTEAGIYYFSTSYTPTNIPAGSNGWLLVLKGNTAGNTKQIWLRAGTPNTNDFQTFTRLKSNNAWGNWREYTTNVKTADFNVSIKPSTSRGSTGYGEQGVDVSSITKSNILAVTFHSSSNYMLWGVTSDLSANPSTINIYGYRLAGTYTGNVTAKMRVTYV